jgi:indole-3-glycerol phosphate synthase
MNYLEKIVAARRERVEHEKRTTDLVRLEEAARRRREDRSAFNMFRAIAQNEGINIIAEFKRASPSKGVIRSDASAAEVAFVYQAGGATAISVLTEQDHFKGSLDDLRVVSAAVSIPILRKDFIVDDFQIFEAAEAGADAILLIAAVLTDEELGRFQSTAASLGLDAIVEVHNALEMDRAVKVRATLIGVNNRDLNSFEVSLNVSHELIKMKPRDSIMISESGLSLKEDVIRLYEAGYAGFLIGETLMRCPDPGAKLREFLASPGEASFSDNRG